MTVRGFASLALVLVLAPTALARAGDDSPWPDTEALRPNVRAVAREANALEARIELMQQTADRYEDWEKCISWVPVSEYGDPDRRFGYRYDERDGTTPGYRPALAVDRRSRPGREDYMFLDFATGSGCESAAPAPGGTAESASLPTRRATGSRVRKRTLRGQVARLERRVRRMKRLSRELEQASERFDAWESCVSWVPLTELGDPDGKFGYAFSGSGVPALAYRTALTIDRSDWDDPDYMFLALVGGDRPGGTCQDEPGEAVD
jgi:hypothetical protein